MLSVWLPLNGDLRNQGLANITATNNGATVDNNGKIGKCYSFDGNDDFISISCSDLYNTFSGGSQPFSIAFWVYHADTTRAIIFGDYGLSGAIGFNVELMTSHQVRFYWNGTPDKHFNVNASVGINTWTHIIITYDGNEICIYKNGVQQSDKYSGTLEAKSKTSGMFYLGRDSRTGSTAFNGKLNDFRIYDHCLSPRECKQVSTALVLHYPLNRGGFGKDNICKNRDVYLTGSDHGAYSTRSYDNEAHIGKIQVTHTNHAWNAWKFGATDLDTTCVELTTGVNTYTMSVDIKVTNYTTGTIKCVFDFRTNNTVLGAYTTLTQGQCDGNWHRIHATLTTNDEKHNQCLWSINSNGTVHGSQTTIEYKNWKLERGDVATPWTPAPSDDLYSQMGLDNNIEYDVSGYGNNGTRNGTFSWSGDTPRYGTSTVFSGNQYIVEPNEIITTDSTIALWVKSSLNRNAHVLDARNNSGIGKQPIYQYTNGGIQTGGNASYVASNSGLLVANTWVHVVLVQNGDSLLIYKNGDLFQTISCANSPVIKPTLGARYSFSSKYTGQLSDFRIYATALSADDVRDLYSVAASVSNNGTLMASEVSEL